MFLHRRSTKKPEPEAPPAKEPQVNGLTIQLGSTKITPAEPAAPDVQIEVTEHEKTEGDTQTKVTEVTTTKTDDGSVEEKKEVSTVTQKNAPGGRLNYQRREESTTTKKKFVGKYYWWVGEMSWSEKVDHGVSEHIKLVSGLVGAGCLMVVLTG